MATAMTAICCYRLHNGHTTKSDFNPLADSSPSSSSRSRSLVCATNNIRRALQHDVGASTSGCSGYVRHASCRVQAILAEPPAPRKDQPLQRQVAEGGATTLSTAPTAIPSSPNSKQEMGLSESSLVSTLEHRLWVAFGASTTVGLIAKSAIAVRTVADGAGMAVAAVAAYVLADLGTGIYHWGIDNYGDTSTPVFGAQIDAFQGHHRRPWTITKREFSNNTQAIARPVGFALLPFLLLPTNPAADTFLGVFLGLVLVSQQLHAWAHSKKSLVPVAVEFLQQSGILISRKMHGIHHGAPYSVNYCIVSGLWNDILNKSKFFLRLEAAIYSRWGVAPRNWADTVASEWVQDGSYYEDGSDIKLDREA